MSDPLPLSPMASSAGNEWTALDRAADALVPTFPRRPGAAPAPAPAAEAAPQAPVEPFAPRPSAPATPIGLPAAIALNPEIPKPARVPDLAPIVAGAPAVDAAPSAPVEPEPAPFSAPRSDRNDATPLAIPQVVLPELGGHVPTQPDPHEAATLRPPTPAPAAKRKKQLRSAPEPSVKAEAGLHAPAARVAQKEESAKIVFNDPQAPSRLPTMPMNAVRLGAAEANRATLRPQKRRGAPIVPALLAVVAILGLAAVVIGSREDAPSAKPAAVAPASEPAARAAEPEVPAVEHEPNVPPPPAEEEAQANEPPPAPKPAPKREIAPAPSASAPIAPIAPTPIAPPPQPATPAPPPAKVAPVVPAPVAPAAAAAVPKSEPRPEPAPAPAAKPTTPPKAPNSSGSPAIVRDNPF